jgi:DMSO reductase anchor subunit
MGATLWLMLSDLFNNGAPAAFSGNVRIAILLVLLVLMSYGLFNLTMHLGKPQFFYRGFYNLKYSPVSREIAGVSLFFVGLVLTLILPLIGLRFLLNIGHTVTAAGFGLGSYYMYKLYRIPARPFWDHWQTGSAFYGTILSLGGVLFGVLLLPFAFSEALIAEIAVVSLAGLLLEAVGHVVHRIDVRNTGEGQASFFEQITTFGKSYQLRNALLIVNMMLMIILIVYPSTLLLTISFITILLSAYLGRILFYALVIPTTMPGAFFWKNDKFKEHAIESGLSEMPQLAVMPQRHHKFDFKALLKVIKESNFQAALTQVKSIIKG